jgi:hypothetical protein
VRAWQRARLIFTRALVFNAPMRADFRISVKDSSTAPGEDVTFDALAPGSYEVKVRGENGEGHGPESELVTVVVT